MRTYESVWIKLKESKDTVIHLMAHPKLHPRIYKAILKEKNMDVVYKLTLSEQEHRAYCSCKSEGMKLSIRLHVVPLPNQTITLEALGL